MKSKTCANTGRFTVAPYPERMHIHMPYNICNNYEKSNTTVSVSQNAEASATRVQDKTYVQTTEKYYEQGGRCRLSYAIQLLFSSKADDAASRMKKQLLTTACTPSQAGNQGRRCHLFPHYDSRRAAEQGLEVVFLRHKGCLDTLDQSDPCERTSHLDAAARC